MKTCGKCKETKTAEEFNWRNKAKGTKNSWCKLCMKTYDRENNKRPERQIMKKKNLARSQQRARDLVLEHLTNNYCVDCGEDDLIVLQFDHEDPNTKEGNISSWVSGGFGVKRIAEEIAKCSVRCANCHMRRTAKQFGWWTTMIM